jgi:hypothetical protein
VLGGSSRSSRVSLWRNIRKDYSGFFFFFFSILFPVRLGMGPEFYSLARNKEALVSQYMDLSSPWNPSFIRATHD